MPSGIIQLLGIGVVYLAVSISSGFCFFIVGYTLTILSNKKIHPTFLPSLFAFSLVVAELLRSYILSIIFYGDNGSVGLHFTSSTLGNTLSITPLIEFAYFGGVFALAFVLGYIVYIVASPKHARIYWKHGVGIAIALVATHFFVPTYGPKDTTVVGVLTTNFPTLSDDELDTSFEQQTKVVDAMTSSFASTVPDIIVYPEDTRYLDNISKEKKGVLSKTFPQTLFIDGSTRRSDTKLVNITLFYDAESKKSVERGKSFLLPFNEFIPLFFKPIFGFFIPDNDMVAYETNHTYTPIYSKKTIVFNNLRIGTLLCSEILSHATLQQLKKERPSLVFFQSHLNVFHDNPWFRAHLYSVTKVAAAQLRSPVISSINGAPSLIVSPYGRIINNIPTGFSTSTYIFQNSR